ncbi:hypothetical protein J5X84_28625 [Streptosporangiaceae bacterium NEAU-GS5]|nr:hypothetical protein [Streptosporangiaceae bacterium NEAU-GS5]
MLDQNAHLPDPERIVSREDLARELSLLRAQSRKSIRELGKSVGVPFGTLGGWFRGAYLPMASQADLFEKVLAQCGVTDPAARDAWVQAMLRVRRLPGRRAAGGTPPFRGLECFQPEDADWFFGRDALTGSLLGHLDEGGLIMVVGPSGSGKSSLLRAGLIASLSGTPSRPWLLVIPGSNPLREFETVLGERRMDEGDRLVIVVDQFEEIFTSATESDRLEFIDALYALPSTISVFVGMRADFYPHALRYPALAATLQTRQVVVGPMTEPELREAIEGPARRAKLDIDDGLVELIMREIAPSSGALPLLSHTLLTTWEHCRGHRMGIEHYRASGGLEGAVARSAEAVYAELTDAQKTLARRLLIRMIHVGVDTADTRRRVERDELFSAADDDQKDQIDHVLDRFVERRLLTSDATSVQISHEALLLAWPRLRSWIDTDRVGLRVHRQLTEAAHSWQASDYDGGVLYRGGRLVTAGEWAADPVHGTDLNLLERKFLDASLEQRRSEQATELRRARRLYQLLGALAVLALLAAGLAGYSQWKRVEADESRDLAISRHVAATANRLKDSDPALAAQLTLAAYRIAPTLEARSALMDVSGEPVATRIVRPGKALQAVAVSPSGHLMAAAGAAMSDMNILLWSLEDPHRPVRVGAPITGHTGPIYAIAFSPDGHVLATAGVDKVVRLWDLTDPAHPKPLGAPLTGPGEQVNALDFSPDGAMLAAGDQNGVVHLWSVAVPGQAVPIGRPLTVPEGGVRALAFRSDSRVLAAGIGTATDGAVQLWDVGTPAAPRPIGKPLPVPSRVNAVIFNPRSDVLVAGSNDGSVRQWDTADPEHVRALGEPLINALSEWINVLAFNSDGTILAVGSADNTARLWDLATRKKVVALSHPEPVTAVAFRHGDQMIVTNSAEGVARVWTMPGPKILSADQPIWTVAFHPTRPLLVTAGSDARLWDVTNRQGPRLAGPPLTAPPPYDRLSGIMALSPDGRTVATGTRLDSDILLWDISDPSHPVQLGLPLTEPKELIELIKFSPDGKLLAAGSDDEFVWLWDVRDLRSPKLVAVLTPRAGNVFTVAFSPDGRTLVAGTQDGAIPVWDISEPTRPALLKTIMPARDDDVYSLAFDPKGTVFASGSGSGTVRFWDIADRSHPRLLGQPLAGPDGRIFTLAYAPDGRTLAAGTGAGQVWTWDVTDSSKPETQIFLHTPGGSSSILAFSPDGRTLASAGGDVRLWDPDPERTATQICAGAGDPLTRSELQELVSDAPYQPICPG